MLRAHLSLPLQKSFHPTDRVDPAQPCLSTLFTQTHRPLLFLLPTPPPNRPSPSFLLTRQTNFAPFSAPCYKGNVQNIIETLMSFSDNLYFPCNCTVEGVSVAEQKHRGAIIFPFSLCCTSNALISHLPFGKCNRRTNVLAPPSCGPTPRVILCVPLPFLVRLLCGLLPLFLLGRGPPVVQEGGGGGLCCTRKGPIVQYRNRRGTLQIEILLKYCNYPILQRTWENAVLR